MVAWVQLWVAMVTIPESNAFLGPKSVIEVRGEDTFLDLAVQQIGSLNKMTGK